MALMFYKLFASNIKNDNSSAVYPFLNMHQNIQKVSA
jgi:hypothetical protein